MIETEVLVALVASLGAVLASFFSAYYSYRTNLKIEKSKIENEENKKKLNILDDEFRQRIELYRKAISEIQYFKESIFSFTKSDTYRDAIDKEVQENVTRCSTAVHDAFAQSVHLNDKEIIYIFHEVKHLCMGAKMAVFNISKRVNVQDCSRYTSLFKDYHMQLTEVQSYLRDKRSDILEQHCKF